MILTDDVDEILAILTGSEVSHLHRVQLGVFSPHAVISPAQGQSSSYLVSLVLPRQTDGSVMSQVDLLVKLQESDVVFYQDLLYNLILNFELEIYRYE